MAKWQDSLITNDGLDMLVQLLNGGTLTITRAALGGGTVDTAALIRQTSLTAPIPVEAKIAQKDVISGAGVNVKIRVTNSGVTTTQTMRQVGVFAKLESGEEKLFAIMQDIVGEEIPTAAEYPEFLLEFTSAIAVSNTDNIVVQISNNVFVTYEDLEDALKGYSKTSHTHAAATQSAAGMMSAADKKKLDGIAEGANKTTVDTALSATSTNPVQNKVVNAALAEKANKADLPTELPAKGGNADTVDGMHAVDFVQNLSTWRTGDIKDLALAANTSGYALISNAVTGMPYDNAWWFVTVNAATVHRNILACSVGGNDIYAISYNASLDEDKRWSAWKNIADGGDAETLGGKSAADFLPITGGTVTGALYAKDSHYVHGIITDGTHGGFYDIAEIAIKTAWANHSVVFTMSNRGSRPITVVLIFTNVATADPEISSLIYYGGSIYSNRVVCYKTGTSTWRLAVHMLDKNDKWTVHDYYRGESKNMLSITWLSDYLSDTIPDGAVVATLGGYVQNAERLNTARAIDGVSFDGTADISHYAICSTAAATAAKTVTLAGFALTTGARVAVKFAETNSAANPTLNVNNTGAKPIYYHGKAIVTGYLNSYRLCEFIYNGSQYEYIGDVDTNTDTKVTAVGNHYTPSGGTTTPASGGALTDIANSSAGVQVITGITMDAAGHVTGVTSVALKSTNTVYTLPNAGTGNYGGVKIGSNITVSNGVIGISAANVAGALGYTPGRLAAGTAAATTSNCPKGAWYGQYE